MPLPDTKIRNAKSQAKPYKLFDGGGLFVLVNPNGSRLWRLKYRYLGKERLFSIGAYPAIGAAQARTERDRVKGLLAQGIDPSQNKKTEKYRTVEASQNTLEAMARRWLDIKKIAPVHKVRSLRRLENHIFPKLGFRPIEDIETRELAECLEAVERKGIAETAHRVKQILQQTFRYAVRRGIIKHNPAGDLRDLLSPPDKCNFACIAPAELPALLQAIDGYNGELRTVAAIRLLALTFTRTSELIGARWDEMNWGREEWQIPAERMKMRREHIVPLSSQAVGILKELHTLTGKHEFVFHSPANKAKHISNNAVLSALKRLGYAGRMTGHGFRSLASTILNEQRQYHPDIIERQLAHADRNQIRAVYNKAEYLLERKKMMQDWGDYLDAQFLAVDTVVLMKSAERKKE